MGGGASRFDRNACDSSEVLGLAVRASMLIIENSAWARLYADRQSSPDGSGVTHYFLLSLNDLLHVLSDGEPLTRWIDPVNA